MRAWVIALIVLSGCVQEASEPPAAPAPIDTELRFGLGETTVLNDTVYPLAPTFSAPVTLPGDGAEPNIARMDGGTLFVTAPAGGTSKANAVEGAAWLWRSNDDGATWETLRSPEDTSGLPTGLLPGFNCSCDADVVTHGDWVYYTDWWIAFNTGNVLVERSNDGGDSWEQASITIPLDKAQSIDRQWLVAGPDGFVMLVYAQFGSQTAAVDADGRIEAVLSSDHGETWSDPVDVVPRDGAWIGLGHPFFAGDALVMPYAYVRSTETFWQDPSDVYVAISGDMGQTWRQEFVADVPGGFDNLWAVQGAADDAGNSYVGWAHRTGDTMTISIASDQHDWEVTNVTATGLHMLPWLAATGNGTVTIGWYGDYGASGDPAEQPEGEWHAWLAESHDGGRSGTIAQVSDAPVKTGNLCPRGSGCSGDRQLLDYWSMTYDDAGRIHASYAVVGGGATIPQYVQSPALDARL